MKTHITSLFAFLALLVSSCDLPGNPATLTDMTFTSEIVQPDNGQGPATRTYIDGTGTNVRMHWTANDAIAIFFSTYGQKFLFQGKTGDRGGAFAAESVVFSGGFETDRYYAIYPYREDLLLDETHGVITTILPATQSYAERSFGLGASVMTAVTQNRNDYHLSFSNALCFLKLQVYGGAKVKTIALQGNNNEPLAGSVEIDTRPESGPVVSFPDESQLSASLTLTLDCGEGVTTGTTVEEATAFFFALPPTTFTKGFTVTITDTEGNAATKATQKTIDIERNRIQPMEAFLLETKPVEPEPVIPNLPPVNNGLPVLYVYMPGFEPAAATTTDLTNVSGIDKENWIENSHAYLKDVDGTVTDLGEASIRGRGNTTWNYVKKPYAFKLGKKASLLGMPADKRWDLLANYLDRTRLRNDLALELGRRLAERGIGFDWTPRGKYVELVVNNVFLGNYYLVEHIKVAKNRVNIKEMKSMDIDEESITGGYLLECGIEMDEGEGHQFWTNYFPDTYPYNRHGKSGNNYHLPVMIKSPEEDITPEQFNWFKNYINGVQSSIVNHGNSWLNDVDIDSFICWMFVQEVVGNYEPLHPKSAFMHKDRGGKLMMGPLWDFDYGTFKQDYAMTPVYHYSIWYPYMLKDAVFKARVEELWPIVKPILREVCSEYAAKFRSSNSAVMPLAVSIDNDWVRWQNLGGQPSVNGDEGIGVWEAFKRLTDNLSRRINQMNDTEINNMLSD